MFSLEWCTFTNRSHNCLNYCSNFNENPSTCMTLKDSPCYINNQQQPTMLHYTYPLSKLFFALRNSAVQAKKKLTARGYSISGGRAARLARPSAAPFRGISRSAERALSLPRRGRLRNLAVYPAARQGQGFRRPLRENSHFDLGDRGLESAPRSAPIHEI